MRRHRDLCVICEKIPAVTSDIECLECAARWLRAVNWFQDRENRKNSNMREFIGQVFVPQFSEPGAKYG